MPIRPATPTEADALTALSLRSKAHWGYDAAFMAKAAPHLVLPPDLLAQGRIWVATSADGPVTGVMALSTPDSDRRADLVLLFVDPPAMGLGHGRALLRHALATAGAEGARHLRVLSDPHARSFYIAHGARQIGMAPSDAIPGRDLPLLEWTLP